MDLPHYETGVSQNADITPHDYILNSTTEERSYLEE